MARLSDTDIVGYGDESEKLQAFFTANAGEDIYFDQPEARTYTVARLDIPSGTRIHMHEGVAFSKRLNAGNAFRLNNSEGVRLYGNGATVYGADVPGTTAFSHTIAMLGAENCKVFGLNVDGASEGQGGKDCLYLGAGANNKPCKNIQVFDSKFLRGKRNCVSVVASKGAYFSDVETAYATGKPGCGVDVEANVYEAVDATTFFRLKSHSNANSGAVSVFGTRSVFDDCDLFSNVKYGLGISSGGTQFDEAVYRENVDMIGIFGFNMATGGVFVAERPPIGTPVNFSVRNGAILPPQFTGGYYVVSRHIGQNEIILGRSVGNSEVLGLTTSGVAINWDVSPYNSDVRLRAFVPGQSDGNQLLHSRLYNNGTQGLIVAGAGDFFGYDCDIYGNGSNQVQFQYTKDVELHSVRVRGAGLGIAGITASGGGGYLRLVKNDVEGTRGRGMAVAEWTNANLYENQTIDCAEFEAGAAKAGLHLSSCIGATVTKHRASQRVDNIKTLFGIYAEASAKNGYYADNDCTGAGTSNLNSFRIMSAANTCLRNKRRDGTQL